VLRLKTKPHQIEMKVEKPRLIENDNVKLHTNPNTGKEEMYVSEDMVPQNVFSMALRVIGSRNGYMFCKAGSWNYFFPDDRGGLVACSGRLGLEKTYVLRRSTRDTQQ
jgi:hypothetical protein